MQSSCLALSDWIRSPKQPHSPHRMETSQKETIFSFSRPSPPASWALPIVSIKQLMSLSGTCQDSWGPVRKKSEPISSETQCPPSSKAFPWHRVCGQSSAPWQDRRWSLCNSPWWNRLSSFFTACQGKTYGPCSRPLASTKVVSSEEAS